MKKRSTLDSRKLSIPVDLYVRHSLAKDVIDTVFRDSEQSKLRILDAGGYRGKTQEFLPQDHVQVLDIYDVDEPSYAKGDATAMTFNDNEFDVVTSFDVLEHIPRAKRKSFISEKLRVAKKGVVMTLPIDRIKDGSTSHAEKQLNNFFLEVSGREHPWLKEHIEYGIPHLAEVEALLKANRLNYKIIFSNDLEAWKLIQAINFSAAVCEEGLEAANKVNAAYNSNMRSLEPVKNNGYRAIVVIAKTSTVYQKLETYDISTLKKDNPSAALDIAMNATLELLALLVKDKIRSTKMQRKLKTKLDQREQRIQQLEEEVSAIKQSKAWKVASGMRGVVSHSKIKRRQK